LPGVGLLLLLAGKVSFCGVGYFFFELMFSQAVVIITFILLLREMK